MNEKKRRIIMTTLGVVICGLSVGIFNFSTFGMDPFQVFAHGIWKHINISFGTFYIILNIIILIAIFFVDKKKIGFGTLLNILLLGYVVEFSTWVMASLIPNPSLIIRTASLLVGIIVLSFGSALYFTGDLGVSTYDAIALILTEKKVAKFQYCRIGTDVLCTLIGFIFGATVGIGTMVTAFFMGPIIMFFNKTVAEPFRYGKKIVAVNEEN